MCTSQAIKDINASYDALVDLLKSTKHFLNCLKIYIKIPPTVSMVEILIKIMVELLSAIALVTKQVKQKHPSESILANIMTSLASMQCSKIYKEAF